MSVVEPEPLLHDVWRVQQQMGSRFVAAVGVSDRYLNVVVTSCTIQGPTL